MNARTLVRFELVAASALTGLLGAVVVYASGVRLGLDRFSPLAQLWTIWALCSASVTFGLQHWTIRSIRLGASVRSLRYTAGPWLAVGSTGVALIGLVMNEQWFDGHRLYAGLTGVIFAATGANGIARGLAATEENVTSLAVLIVGENAIRAVLLVPLLMLDSDPIWYGLALLAGFAVVLRPTDSNVSEGRTMAMPAGTRMMVGTSTVGFLSYAVMFGSPLLIGAAGFSSSSISGLFLVMALARVPFVMVLGLLPHLANEFESAIHASGVGALIRLRRNVAGGAFVGALIVWGVAEAIAGPTVGRLFGTNVEFSATVYAWVGAASVLSLGGLVLSILAVAIGRTTELLVIWSIPLVIAGFVIPFGLLDTVEQISIGLAVTEAAVLGLLVGLVGHSQGAR